MVYNSYFNSVNENKFTGEFSFVNLLESQLFDEFCNFSNLVNESSSIEEQVRLDVLREFSFKDVGTKIKEVFTALATKISTLVKKIKNFIKGKFEAAQDKNLKKMVDAALKTNEGKELFNVKLKVEKEGSSAKSVPDYDTVIFGGSLGEKIQAKKVRNIFSTLVVNILSNCSEDSELWKDYTELLKAVNPKNANPSVVKRIKSEQDAFSFSPFKLISNEEELKNIAQVKAIALQLIKTKVPSSITLKELADYIPKISTATLKRSELLISNLEIMSSSFEGIGNKVESYVASLEKKEDDKNTEVIKGVQKFGQICGASSSIITQTLGGNDIAKNVSICNKVRAGLIKMASLIINIDKKVSKGKLDKFGSTNVAVDGTDVKYSDREFEESINVSSLIKECFE